MHDTQCRVTVLDFLHQDTQCPNIIDFVELQPFGSHLVPDAVDVFGPPLHFRLDPGGTHLGLETLDGHFDETLALHAPLIDHLRNPLVGFRFQKAER